MKVFFVGVEQLIDLPITHAGTFRQSEIVGKRSNLIQATAGRFVLHFHHVDGIGDGTKGWCLIDSLSAIYQGKALDRRKKDQLLFLHVLRQFASDCLENRIHLVQFRVLRAMPFAHFVEQSQNFGRLFGNESMMLAHDMVSKAIQGPILRIFKGVGGFGGNGSFDQSLFHIRQLQFALVACDFKRQLATATKIDTKLREDTHCIRVGKHDFAYFLL